MVFFVKSLVLKLQNRSIFHSQPRITLYPAHFICVVSELTSWPKSSSSKSKEQAASRYSLSKAWSWQIQLLQTRSKQVVAHINDDRKQLTSEFTGDPQLCVFSCGSRQAAFWRPEHLCRERRQLPQIREDLRYCSLLLLHLCSNEATGYIYDSGARGSSMKLQTQEPQFQDCSSRSLIFCHSATHQTDDDRKTR